MILFCEYVIPDNHREAYLAWVHADPERWRGIDIAENTGQAGVFVEIQSVESDEEAAATEKERREGRSWIEMEQWVKGGKAGLRLWTFRPLIING
ncbi:hypothetical protein [Cohnella mopanensis]|uniref:hypothetical protein n=1 Tax=Cohnella mopanensis TaxID=2911966 RepID=UPI001EF9928B|nr:hypothetical protein [Cohnella mopanensis]